MVPQNINVPVDGERTIHREAKSTAFQELPSISSLIVSRESVHKVGRRSFGDDFSSLEVRQTPRRTLGLDEFSTFSRPRRLRQTRSPRDINEPIIVRMIRQLEDGRKI